MEKYLGCLFSFSCPHPHVSPGHPAGRSQDKPKLLCLGFQCHLMSTWDQRVQKCFCDLFPAQHCGTWLWQSHLHSGYLPHALCSLTTFLFTHSFASSPFLLQFFPVPRSRGGWWLPWSLFPCLQPVQLPAAPTVTSGCLVLPQRACSHPCWWFTGFGGPHKWTEAITVASWNSPQITSPCLHFYVSFTSSL